MVRILVDPDHLQALAARLQSAAQELEQRSQTLGTVRSSLDMQVRQRANVEEEIGQAVQTGHSLVERANQMATFLTSKAARFREADQAGVNGMPHTPIPPFPLPVPTPTPRPWPAQPVPHTPMPPPPPHSGNGGGGASGGTTSSEGPTPVALHDGVNPSNYSSCAIYAQTRRPDLGYTGGAGGAADYLTKPGLTHYQITANDTNLQDRIATGYAIVWDRNNPSLAGTPGYTYGHVAIVEQIYPDHVVVSQANWPGHPTMSISRDQLESLYVIPGKS
ncbi:MAG: CHAP domain-containing protein [Chloroflexota bacterium]|nr:CHAP domain-containing protein [Chloroflexota bacterium]